MQSLYLTIQFSQIEHNKEKGWPNKKLITFLATSNELFCFSNKTAVFCLPIHGCVRIKRTNKNEMNFPITLSHSTRPITCTPTHSLLRPLTTCCVQKYILFFFLSLPVALKHNLFLSLPDARKHILFFFVFLPDARDLSKL